MSDYRVKGIEPDMTEAAFLAVLDAAKSPVRPGEARAVYSYCLARGASPAWLLAVFKHESSFGKAGTATQTHSWGNTRAPSFGVPDLGQVPGRSGSFSKYANWADGGVSTVARIYDHKPYAYAVTVREITPIWAPPSDQNDTERYIAAVLADIARYAQLQEPTPVPQETSMDALAKLADRQDLMSEKNGNWGKTTMRGGWPTWITVHETGNRDPGANAEMHAEFVKNGGGKFGVSFHACVDESESVQIMPWNWVAWHASDGSGDGNYDSIAIETCQIGDFDRTIKRLALLVARLMIAFDIPLARVVQHNHWAPDKKNCPELLRANNNAKWAGLLAGVRVTHAALLGQGKDGVRWYIDAEGRTKVEIDYGGIATEILGVALVDVGVSVKNAKGEVYDRSLQNGVFGEWVPRT